MNKKITFIFWLFASTFCLLAFLYCKQHESGNTNKTANVVRICGSESEINLIRFFAEEFRKKDSSITFEINGGGSGVGIQALMFDKADLANSSRAITNEEIAKAKEKGKNVTPVIIGLDVVAIIANSGNGVDTLSLEQLGKIFNGTYTNWSQLGGANIPIKTFGRNKNSGTYHYLRDRFLIKNYSDSIIAMNDNNKIIDIVQSTKGSISYISMGSINESKESFFKKVWVINTYYEGGKPHSPFDKEAVKAGEYPLTRPLYQYLVEPAKKDVLKLIQFELSLEQQNNMESHGFYPITPIHKTINKKSISDLVF